uniref:Dynein regulatory complex subunit 3 n=1 Tax=Seriola lalandi dorsalis TaxID=1841481 RepID=A0A3B4YRY4_SERLL
MKKLNYESKQTLMDEEVLQKAVAEQTSKAGKTATAVRIDFDAVPHIRLEYKNIQWIDHLWDFTSLARLDLNNNLIEKIEGLDRLISLTWLDLSFNKIEKIEGLESLQKLELLNLSNNRISVIENMDKLETLSHFLIANNLLGQLDNVLYLRKFKNLFTLNLSGNPVSKEDDYKFFIAAYFPNLMYLDYRLLSDETVKASSKYHYVLVKMRHEELQRQQAHAAEQSQKAELQLHKDAFVESLNGSYLFESMFKDDPEAEALHFLVFLDPTLTFEHQMVDLCMQLFEIGLADHKRRETEVNYFFRGQTRALTDYQQKVSQTLADFEQQHKEVMELQQLSDPDIVKVKISHYNDEISKLSNSLMSLEFQMVSQLEDIIKKLDINISEMVANFSETIQGIYPFHYLEDNYNQNVRKIAVATLEKVAKDDLDDDIPDDVRSLFTDKDSVMDALSTGHDNHLLKINNRETELVTGVNAWKNTYLNIMSNLEEEK